MENINLYARVCVVVVLIIVVYYAWQTLESREKFLTGFWVTSDPQFCIQAGVSSMLWYIGEPRGYNAVMRDCYMIMAPEVDQPFSISYSRFSCDCVISSVDKVIPDNITLDIDYIAGILRVRADGKLYAVLYKNAELTHTVARDSN